MASSSRLPSTRRPAGFSSHSRPMSMYEVPSEQLNRLQQAGEGTSNTSLDVSSSTDKQAKRRSLLPTFSSRKGYGDEREAIAAIREDTSDTEFDSRSGTRDERLAMPPPPKPTRTSSVRIPGKGIPGQTISHGRTVSRDSNGASAKPTSQSAQQPTSPQKSDTGIKRTGSTRLPQSPRVGGLAAPGHQTIPTRGSSIRAAISMTGAQKRGATAINKVPALDTSCQSESSNQTSPISPTESAASRQSGSITNNNAKRQLQPPFRPSFTTYQQHYSPAKSSLPKPPLPIAKAPKPATPVTTDFEVPMTLEVASEQIELLQLSILHQTSSEVAQEYEASAKYKLLTHRERLRKDYESIRVQEQEQQRVRNLAAIEMWCPDATLLAEYLQTLSRVVSDLRGHTESGSRFSDLTGTFDKWAANAESTLLDSNQPASFIEGLPESWRATHTSLALKLRSIQRDISTMPASPPGFDDEDPSSLEIILECCSDLVDSMLKQLEVMTKLQKEVLQQGKARIDEQINALASENDGDTEKENWIPAWT